MKLERSAARRTGWGQIKVPQWGQLRVPRPQLAGEIPAALLADLLGVHVATATKWAEIAGRPWADYAAQRAGLPRT